jgi:hypothetical protein
LRTLALTSTLVLIRGYIAMILSRRRGDEVIWPVAAALGEAHAGQEPPFGGVRLRSRGSNSTQPIAVVAAATISTTP